MKDIKLFFKNLKQYMKYATYTAKADLKTEVANSYLNWLWWILDPLAFMIIYIYVAKIVFKAYEPHFAVFILIGLTTWTFFELIILGAVKLIKNHKHIISKVYIPKYILLLQRSLVYFFKTMISFGLLLLLILFSDVELTWNLFYFFPLLALIYIISYSFGLILLHFGVYIDDLFNLTKIVLKMLFYLSGIFYSIKKRIPKPWNNVLVKVNPVAFVIDQMRTVILYKKSPDFKMCLIWLVISLVIGFIGIKIIHKYENSYAKIS